MSANGFGEINGSDLKRGLWLTQMSGVLCSQSTPDDSGSRTLLREDAGPHERGLRAVFDGLRDVVKTGAPCRGKSRPPMPMSAPRLDVSPRPYRSPPVRRSI
jgi:hypothetical protein